MALAVVGLLSKLTPRANGPVAQQTREGKTRLIRSDSGKAPEKQPVETSEKEKRLTAGLKELADLPLHCRIEKPERGAHVGERRGVNTGQTVQPTRQKFDKQARCVCKVVAHRYRARHRPPKGTHKPVRKSR